MQLAGSRCGICNQSIVFDADATWCARCSTVVHRQCLTAAHQLCSTCHAPFDSPEAHFVFSELCPECFRPNVPSQPECSSCRARTRWDTHSAYDDFVAHMKDTSKVYAFRGIAELIAGALCAIAAIVMLLAAPIIWLGPPVLGFFLLTADGISRLLRSRQIAKFK